MIHTFWNNVLRFNLSVLLMKSPSISKGDLVLAK
jgi:hypothetical protein